MSVAGSNAAMIKLFRDELRLCEIDTGHKVAVLSEGDGLRPYAEAFLAAARDLGADVMDVNIPSSSTARMNDKMANMGRAALSAHPGALQDCAGADLVIDHMLLLFSKEQVTIQQAGARVLLVVEPLDVLKRLFPTRELRRRVEAAEARLRNASLLRFTNAWGTDVTYELGGAQVLSEYGYTSTPGRWDHWPGGFAATIAKTRGVNGRVVMAPGDIIYPLRQFVEKPIEFRITDGYVTEICGHGDELRRYMAAYGDPRAYAVSHIGWGLNQKCKWDVGLPGIGMDGRAYYGNVLFSLGPDTEFGGENDTPCHLDLPMRGCTLYLDEELIVHNGSVISEDMRASGYPRG